jgi:adenine-specific DNA-methyltransferase
MISKFPKTRYQGSKLKLKDWIKSNLESLDFDTALDAFSGTASIGYLFKEMDKTVYSNDILPFNKYVAQALIENNNEKITDEDILDILKEDKNFKYDYFISNTFKDIYYLNDENKWLDIIVQNILRLKNEYKKSMFFWALFQSCISKRPYNLFHRKNLHVRTADVERTFGNKKTWDRPFEIHFRKFIKEINNAIIDNKRDNKSFCSNIFDFTEKTDLVYIDPPYIPKKGSLTCYGDFYHFLTGMTDYYNWGHKIDNKSKHKKLISTYNIWEDKKEIANAFDKLINQFKDSIIVISYRDDGIPSIDEITSILEKYGKKVEVNKIKYNYALSKNKELKEVLIIGT